MLMTNAATGMGLFGRYQAKAFDEMFVTDGRPRPHYAALCDRLDTLGAAELERRHKVADLTMRHQGITFTVYGREQGVEQIIPFDPIPRLVASDEWDRLERGLKQRVRALNLFLHDVYHERQILKDRVIPIELVLGASGYRREFVGLSVPKDIYIHISGIDLIRDTDGEYLVLEDNCRTPSGVSYVLKNREVMKHVFPFLFQQYNVRPIEDYAANLRTVLRQIAPAGCDDPTIVVLTPGVYNSAYYEHSFLARKMGVELVEGRDLVLDRGQIFMRTTRGLQRVDVIYRRVDDDFLDPLTFRPDSQLGVAGPDRRLPRGQRRRWPTRSAPGVADDKGIYPYVPDIIRYYLSEDPLLANVETFRPTDPRAETAHPGEPGVAGRQGRRCVGGLRHVDRPGVDGGAARGVRAEDRVEPAGLHRAADDLPEPAPDLRRRPARREAHRPPPVHPLRRRHHHPARRPDPRRAAQGEPGGQQLARRGDQGHLGPPRQQLRAHPLPEGPS